MINPFWMILVPRVGTAALSHRQNQCLELVAAGRSSKEIARQLGLSPSTVDNHIRTALDKLGLDDRVAAARLLAGARSATAGGSADEAGPTRALPSLLKLPPLGGKPNLLPIRIRLFHIVQIALLSLMMFSAVLLAIMGLVQLYPPG